MVNWDEFKVKIQDWVAVRITDDEFHNWLGESVFESDADRRLADVFIQHHNDGYWSGSHHHSV